MKYLYITILLLLIQFNTSYSQYISSKNYLSAKLNSRLILQKDKNETESTVIPVAIGLASFLYLFNPIVQFQNDKISGGLTKEVSLGFGYFGQYRAAVEYTYLFRENQKSLLRAGLKYDILLKSGIQPSNKLQTTSVFTVGGGYFTDFENQGFFPEFSYGYSFRNDKLLIYPSIKIRYTFVKNGSDITDISFGIVLGFANPFMDLKIRTSDNKIK